MPLRLRSYTLPLEYAVLTDNDEPDMTWRTSLADAWMDFQLSLDGRNDYRELNQLRWGKIGQYILKPMCPTMLMS